MNGRRNQLHGLSPRVRGNPVLDIIRYGITGSIPACAGEPGKVKRARRLAAVYPRVCGGTPQGVNQDALRLGLSPRVRGNRRGRCERRRLRRSIPACAGEPPAQHSDCSLCEVYPRVCGGTFTLAGTGDAQTGLSPRVRGNRRHVCAWRKHLGSIPACAGEPHAGQGGMVSNQVYPRVCGGTLFATRPALIAAGLSPRVRGNHGNIANAVLCGGSIPACAGEPNCSCGRQRWAGVYPRVCGGTFLSPFSGISIMGLSPRVRGEPSSATPSSHTSTVYPRVCGGTEAIVPLSRMAEGLSPRVRGNRRVVRGSTVYLGLSPRVRGNQKKDARKMSGKRSIPACAGEPFAGVVPLVLPAVYPRVCGGTT